MLYVGEKQGRGPQQQSRREFFLEFVNSSELMDLELKGYRFTWTSNPRDGHITRERIDRVLVNYPWRIEYPNAMATSLPIIS